MIGDSKVLVDKSGDITIKDRLFRGTKGLWELLTLKNVNTEAVTQDDLKSYKKILSMTNAHLTRYQPDCNINITRGKKFREIIAHLFAKAKRRGVESSLRRKWTKY